MNVIEQISVFQNQNLYRYFGSFKYLHDKEDSENNNKKSGEVDYIKFTGFQMKLLCKKKILWQFQSLLRQLTSCLPRQQRKKKQIIK